MIERTNDWHNLLRNLRIRHEKTVANYLGLAELASAVVVYRLVRYQA